jgi:hypothetical protein
MELSEYIATCLIGFLNTTLQTNQRWDNGDSEYNCNNSNNNCDVDLPLELEEAGLELWKVVVELNWQGLFVVLAWKDVRRR